MTEANTLSPLKKGWLYTSIQAALAYVATKYITMFNATIDVTFVGDYIGLNTWLSWKGLDLRTLDAAALCAGVCFPLGLAAWHWFAVDARPRRPIPKLWHSLFPIAYLIPLIALLSFRPSTTKSSSFSSPLLVALTRHDIGTSLLFSGFSWLGAGLIYMTILPLVELSRLREGRN